MFHSFLPSLLCCITELNTFVLAFLNVAAQPSAHATTELPGMVPRGLLFKAKSIKMVVNCGEAHRSIGTVFLDIRRCQGMMPEAMNEKVQMR